MDQFFKNLLSNFNIIIIIVWLAIVVFLSTIKIKVLEKDTATAIVQSILIASLVCL